LSGGVQERQRDAAPGAGDDVPSGQQDREDHVMAGEVPVEQGDAAREQHGLLGREGLQQGLLAVGGLPGYRAADGAAGAGGQGDDPQLRERGGPVPGPGRAEIVPVLFRVGQVDQHPVGGVGGHACHHDRGRLAVADQGAGRVPEDLLHDLRGDQ
jgi:hypothetical protein